MRNPGGKAGPKDSAPLTLSPSLCLLANCLSIHLSVSLMSCLSIHPSIHQSDRLSIWQNVWWIVYPSLFCRLSAHRSVLHSAGCLSILLSINLVGCLPTHLSIKLASCLSIWQTVHSSTSLADSLSIHLSISLEGHLSIPSVCPQAVCPPVSPAGCLSTHLFVSGCMSFICQSAGCLSICLSTSLMIGCLSSHLSISLTVCPTIYQFGGLSIHLPICLVGSLPIHLSINLTDYLSICLPVWWTVYPSVHQLSRPSVHPQANCPSFYPSSRLSVQLYGVQCSWESVSLSQQISCHMEGTFLWGCTLRCRRATLLPLSLGTHFWDPCLLSARAWVPEPLTHKAQEAQSSGPSVVHFLATSSNQDQHPTAQLCPLHGSHRSGETVRPVS